MRMLSQDQAWEYENRNSAGTQIEITFCHKKAEEIVIPATIDGRAVYGIGGFRGNAFPGTKVILQEGIREIRNSAFALSQIRDIRLPESLIQIQKGAFFGCRRLERVEFRNGLRVIGRSAFRNCTALKEIALPMTCAHLGVGAFEGCSSLKSAVIAAQTAWVSRFCFAGCIRLMRVCYSEGAHIYRALPHHTQADAIPICKPEGLYMVYTRETALRTSPGAWYGKQIAALYRGTALRALGDHHNAWLHVRAEDGPLIGYVRAEDVRPVIAPESERRG